MKIELEIKLAVFCVSETSDEGQWIVVIGFLMNSEKPLLSGLSTYTVITSTFLIGLMKIEK